MNAVTTSNSTENKERPQGSGSKLWYAYGDPIFKGTEPFFYEPSDFEWTRHIEENWQTIRDELRMLRDAERNPMEPYVNTAMVSRPNQWKTFGMMFWGIPHIDKARQAPKTWELLKGIPNIMAMSFNLLEPNSTIKPHNGDTNAIIRCHFGLDIPATAPRCAFRVGTETRGWEEGKWLMFCDAHEHTAWNNTDRQRYILVIDVLRPEFVSRRRWIASRVLASINLDVYYLKYKWLRRFFGSERAASVLLQIIRAGCYARLTRYGV